MKFSVFMFAIVLFNSNSSQADLCLGWFLESGLVQKQDDCEMKCAVTPVDMGTFSCPAQCEDLCSKSLPEQILTYVPRLTEGDKVAITKMPYEAYKVFIAKEKVDKLVVKLFKKPTRKDESDAFRHFVWSVLVAQEIGIEKARVFLIAHEQDATQSKAEKEMDLKNNDQGLSFFLDRQKTGKRLELIDIEKEALNRLRLKKLEVIRPRFKEIPGGYYSK